METIVKIQPVLTLVFTAGTFVGMIIAVYKTFRDPDIKAQGEIDLMKQACQYKHKGIDDDIKTIKSNHLTHIEKDVAELKENQVKIFTILDERLPAKK